MNQALKIVEYAWLLVIVLCSYQIFGMIGSGKTEIWYFIAFLGFAIFMYFFRKRTRIKYMNRQAEKEAQQ